MELRISIRQTQYFAIETSPSQGLVQGQPIIYAGLNPATLHPVSGTVQFGNYFDVTEDVANLDKIQLTWTTDRDINGVSIAGAFKAKRTATNQLQIEGEAYRFIKQWLVEDVAAPLNTIDVRIEDTSCGVYEDWVIKPNQVSWCMGEICEFSVSLQQKDEPLQCIQNTIISDNWQGWFNEIPDNGKKHPRFVYCNEVKPNGMMVTLWWLMSLVFTIVYLLTPVINTVIAIIGVILSIIDAISWLFGGSPDFEDNFPFFNPSDLTQSFFMESSGCGRLHPAPLIRDYINNVCQKCGIQVDAVTSPIFHSQTINIDLSSDQIVRPRSNPYYNATYLNAPIKRGIRIFRGLFNNEPNTTDFFIPDNRPILALDQFLDEIKVLFNSEWRLTSVNGQPTLYVWRKDWFTNGSPLYDFSEGTEDRLKIIQGICFNWLDKNQYAFMRGIYQDDASDRCGSEALGYMNDIISMGDKTNNPSYDGGLDKRANYGGTRFRLDGASDDYLANGMQVLLNGAALNPTIPFIVMNAIVPAVSDYADYALLMSDESCSLPKIIIWDENSGYDFAKSVRTKSAYLQSINGSSLPVPVPNQNYNPDNTPWYVNHDPKTHVTGNGLSFGSEPKGKYTVQEYFGIDFYARPSELVNYPMFFQSKYSDNLFDYFHWIDDTKFKPAVSLEWSLKMELCCDDLERLEVLGDSTNVALMKKVTLPDVAHYNQGVITEITVSYDSEDEYGKYIELKGKV
jgi:hypothetical protein